MNKYTQLEKIIGYTFNSKSILLEAITHSSYAYEKKLNKNYERLEFLGDAVLELIITEYLVIKYKNLNEGMLSQYKSFFVSENFLSEIAKKIKLHEVIRLGKGEIVTGGNQKPSLLADAFESLLAAIYLDGGYNEARRIVLTLMSDLIDQYIQGEKIIDPKTELQKITQKQFGYIPEYSIIKEEGPEHDKLFTVKLKLHNATFTGTGKNKKKAEINAAKKGLNFLQSHIKMN